MLNATTTTEAKMTDAQINTLMDPALHKMMATAVEWWKKHVTGKTATEAAEVLVKHLRHHGKLAVEQGLKDAKDALDAGMPQMATATFMASFPLAGIEAAEAAAKELGLEVR